MTAEPLSELIIRTSYDKSARLTVPVFAADAKRKQVAVRERVAAGLPCAALAGPLAAAGAALAEAMARGMRWEPLNTTDLHRAYPSPRGLFPIGVRLRIGAGEAAVRLRYDPAHHALLLPRPDWAEDAAGSIALELIADLEAIAPLYGDLAPSLCALEAGHLAQAICAALARAGTPHRCQWAGADAGDGGDPVLAVIALDGEAMLAADHVRDAARPLRIAVPAPEPGDAALVARVRGWFDTNRAPAADARAAGFTPELEGPAQPGPRSSGNHDLGTRGAAAAPAEIARLRRALAAVCAAADPGPVTVTLLTAQDDFSVAAETVGGGSGGGAPLRVEQGWPALADAFGTLYNIDLATVPLVVCFSARWRTLIERASAWEYLQLLGAAGLIAQQMCEAAARLGFFARPFRGMIEERLEATFAIDGQCFYTLLIGKLLPDNNPALRLRDWSGGAAEQAA